MADLGLLMDLGHLLNVAYTLYTGYNDAPEEISRAAEHIDGMRLLLKGVETDIIKKKTSFWHQTTDIAKSHKLELKRRLKSCKLNLDRGEALLKKYHAVRRQGISAWDRWKWSHHGRQDLKETEHGLMMATHELEVFMSRVGLSVLYKVEDLIEQFSKRMENLERFILQNNKGIPPPLNSSSTQKKKSLRSKSNVAPTLYAGLFISKLKAKTSLKRKNTTRPKIQKRHTATGKLKPLKKTLSGFKADKSRTKQVLNHVAHTAANTRPRAVSTPQSQKQQRLQTPSPPRSSNNKTTIPSPPLRRSSSLTNLSPKPKTITITPSPPTLHLECYRIGSGQYFLGPPIHKYVQHKRGQAQLRKMAALFTEVSGCVLGRVWSTRGIL